MKPRNEGANPGAVMKGFNVTKRKGAKNNKMRKNSPKFNKSPKAKKMKSPYKTKQGKDAKKKGKMTKFQKKTSEDVKKTSSDSILEEEVSSDVEIVDEDTTLENTPVKSILKTAKKSNKGEKEVSFSSESPNKSIKKKDDLSVKAKKRKLDGDGNNSEESEAKSPKLCEMKKKDRKLLRRKQEKSKVYDLSLKTKKIWEIMRREDCTDEKRQYLCKNLMSLVTGHVKELIFAHDTVRVIECLFAHANKDQKSALFEELKDSVILLSKSKYAKFFVLKVLKHGSKSERNEIIQAFVGKVSKLINHSEAAEVLEEAYNDYANASQRSSLVQEFYGPTFAVFKEEGVTGLQSVLEKHVAQKDSILAHLKDILIKLPEKQVAKHSIVHNVLKDYLTFADEKGRAEVIEAWRESLCHIVHTRDGSRATMMCLWHGTAKDRKLIMKSFKTLVSKIAIEEQGSLVLMAIFDCVDDTKFVEKVIVNELLQDMANIVNNIHSRKVLLYLLCPRDPHHFHPDVVAILSRGDKNTHSKKENSLRHKELNSMVSKLYLKYIAENVQTLVKDSHTVLFVLTTLQKASADRTEACQALSKFLLAQSYQSGKGNNIHPIEEAGSHMFLKKLIRDDAKSRDSTDKVFFSEVFVSEASPDSLKSWIDCNRGCFLLLLLLETELPKVVEFVTKEMQGLNKKLSQFKYKGAELLLKKLKEINVKVTK